MDLSRSLIRLGEKMRGPTGNEHDVTPETIMQMIKDIDEIRRMIKHITVELEDLRERIR